MLVQIAVFAEFHVKPCYVVAQLIPCQLKIDIFYDVRMVKVHQKLVLAVYLFGNVLVEECNRLSSIGLKDKLPKISRRYG